MAYMEVPDYSHDSDINNEHDESIHGEFIITDDEMIYDSNFTAETCSLIDPDHWHENDLLLAAELGKTLLERNRQLECHLSHLKGVIETQSAEIDLLTKQLNALRDLSKNKMQIYEDVDRHCQDLEKENHSLKTENRAEKQRICSLTKLLETLEARNDVLKRRLLETKTESELVQTHTPQKSSPLCKASSVPSIKVWHDANIFLEPQIKPSSDEVMNKSMLMLRDRVNQLQLHFRDEQCRRAEAELELHHQMKENEVQRDRLRHLESLLEDAQRDLQNRFSEPCPVCSRLTERNSCGSKDVNLLKEVEYDQVVSQHACHFGRLRTGGSVYSSHDSLNKFGAELISSSDEDRNDGVGGGISLLTELHDKYNELVHEYQTLIDKKSVTVPMLGRETDVHYDPKDFEARLDAIFDKESRAKRKIMVRQDYKPRYKDLFREAFSTLQDIKEHRKA